MKVIKYLYVERQLHLVPLVVPRLPVRDEPHALLAGAEPLAKRPVLRLVVPAAVRVVEPYVQEERPAGPPTGQYTI
jgi:hypothetical protein